MTQLTTLFENPAYALTESEIRLILLQFFKLNAKQEAIILNIASVSAYKQRTRLRQKLHLKENNNLFDFLKAYCIGHK